MALPPLPVQAPEPLKQASDLGRSTLLPPGRPPLRLLPAFGKTVRWISVLETVLFLALALGLDVTLFDGMRYRDVSPHPFWVIILLVCLRYGTTEGLMTIVLCTATLLVGNLPEPTINQDMFDYTLSVSRLPLLWLMIGVLVGELRNRQIRERDQLREDLNIADRQNETLTTSYEKLSRLNEDLESRVAGQLRTVISIYQAARKIERLGAADVLEGVADMVRSLMQPQKFSVFLLEDGGGLRAVVSDGWKEDDHYARHYTPDSSLYAAVVGERRILTVTDPRDAGVLRHDGLVAGPMHSATTGEVIGMLKIEAMPFSAFNIGALENFRTVCEWVGTAYANARLYETAKTESMINPELGLMSDGFLTRQTELMTSLARRLNFDVALLTVREAAGIRDNPDEARKVARALGEAVQNSLRRTDMAFDRQSSHGGYAILLPNTPADGAQIALDKMTQDLMEHLKDLDPPPVLETSVLMLHQRTEG